MLQNRTHALVENHTLNSLPTTPTVPLSAHELTVQVYSSDEVSSFNTDATVYYEMAIIIISHCYVVAKCNMQHNALLKVIMH